MNRLEKESLQWPCRQYDDPGTPVFYIRRLLQGVRVSLFQLSIYYQLKYRIEIILSFLQQAGFYTSSTRGL